MNIFCFGMGNVASNLKNSYPNLNFIGTHSNKDKLQLGDFVFNMDEEPDFSAFKDSSHILISIPPDQAGDPTYNRLVDKIKNIKNLKWLGYISSTSVYGDHQGDWVNENSDTIPLDEQGKNRLIAEKQWLSSGLPVSIIRMAGIYDAKHSVLNSIFEGKAIRVNAPGHFFSRIYMKDIVRAIFEMMNKPKPYEIYNFADDFPSSNAETISYACKALGIEEPPIVELTDDRISENLRKYYKSNKKVSNEKLKKDYNFSFQFPSYKEGLNDLIAERDKR